MSNGWMSVKSGLVAFQQEGVNTVFKNCEYSSHLNFIIL